LRAIRIITLVLTLFVVSIVVFAFSLDSEWQVSVSETIPAPQTEVFSYVNTLKNWPQWTVWNKTNYPQMTWEFSGAASGVGAIQRWNDSKETGILEILKTVDNQSLEYRLDMSNGKFIMYGDMSFESTASGTKVTWRVTGDNEENLIARLATFVFKPMIKDDLTAGLKNLQRRFTSKNIEN
jgi:hypothetical protein